MANIFEFKVTNKVKDTLDLGFGNFSAGETFRLNDVQVKRLPVRNALELGYIEFVYENSDPISSAMMEYWDGTISYRKNMIPASSVEFVPPLASGGLVNAVGADLSAGFTFGRKVVISGFSARFTTAPLAAGTNVPRILATAGDPAPLTPLLLTAYDDTAGTYTAATNGSIATAAPIVWAANDMLIVGYSEKFASVVCNMTTPCNAAGRTVTPYYWDGTEWVAFVEATDYTQDAVAGTAITFSRVGDNDNSRVVWWETPDAWVAGGPTGSGANSSTYCVALKFNGVLTALAGASVYPVLDTPIADINLGSEGLAAPEAVVLKLGATYTDETGVDVAWALNAFTTTDYIWVGFSEPQQGFAVDVTGVNANAVTKVVTYWNGNEWVSCPTITDGTEAGGATFAKDGNITMAILPIDWTAAAATDTNVLGTSAPSTVTTDELYWLRYTTSGAMDANATAVILYGIPGVNVWHNIEPKYMTFVDADQEVHLFVIDENTTIAGLNINAMVADI